MKRPVGVLIAVAVAVAGPTYAHDFNPALLSLTERTPGHFDVVWRVPAGAGSGAVWPVFPPGTTRVGVGARAVEGDMLVERFGVRRADDFGGQMLRTGGASPVVNEVLVRIERRGGKVVTGRFARGESGFEVPRTPTRSAVAWLYLRLGVEHILTGLDHLAFVLALVLLAGAWRVIVRAVTAFTVAHSLTLALAALGLAHVPQAPVEATIALSIVFVARELLLRDRPGTRPARVGVTPVAFAFGLLHGLGFAGALAEVGLPEGDIPLALFCFNVGVELGQLAFVGLALALRHVLAPALDRLAMHRPRAADLLAATPAALIGALGAFWLIDRLAGF